MAVCEFLPTFKQMCMTTLYVLFLHSLSQTRFHGEKLIQNATQLVFQLKIIFLPFFSYMKMYVL